MATNAPKGSGRKGAVKKRDQVHNPKNKRWTKRNTASKKFLDQKDNKSPFKGVKKVRSAKRK